jgi:hypothetical protein
MVLASLFNIFLLDVQDLLNDLILVKTILALPAAPLAVIIEASTTAGPEVQPAHSVFD